MNNIACFYILEATEREKSAIISECLFALCQAATDNLENKMAARQKTWMKSSKNVPLYCSKGLTESKKVYLA